VNSYYEDTAVTVECDFSTAIQQPVTPSSVTLKWGLKGGSATTVTSGFTEPATGVVQWTIDTTGLAQGIYQAQWEGSGGLGKVVNVDEFYLYEKVF
jgi:hypothetical protein